MSLEIGVRIVLAAVVLVVTGLVLPLIAQHAMPKGTVEWIREHRRVVWIVIGVVVVFVTILSVILEPNEGGTEKNAGSPPTEQITAAVPSAIPSASVREPLAKQCDDLLPPGSCEKSDPQKPEVKLEVGTVSVNQDGVLTFSVTLRNEGVDYIDDSAYGISSWHAVGDDNRLYKVEKSMSETDIQYFAISGNDSRSGLVYVENLSPSVGSFTLVLPPFGTVGPFQVSEVGGGSGGW